MEVDNLIAAKRVKADSPDALMASTHEAFGIIDVSRAHFEAVVAQALTIGWTRDPFDRLIVANAMVDGAKLITADEKIRAHFKDAVW